MAICGFLVVIAVTDARRSTHGLSAFIVGERDKGVFVPERRKQLGCGRATPRADLRRLRHSRREPVRQGRRRIYRRHARARRRPHLIAALSLGMAEGAYEAALKYSKQRKQFGKAIQRLSGDPVEAG